MLAKLRYRQSQGTYQVAPLRHLRDGLGRSAEDWTGEHRAVFDRLGALAGKVPQATPASVHAAGASAAEELQKTARVTKLALNKLARAATTAADEDVKKDLEQQAADLSLSAPSKDFSSELWLQFNRRFWGCFEDPLLVTAILIDPGNRGL